MPPSTATQRLHLIHSNIHTTIGPSSMPPASLAAPMLPASLHHGRSTISTPSIPLKASPAHAIAMVRLSQTSILIRPMVRVSSKATHGTSRSTCPTTPLDLSVAWEAIKSSSTSSTPSLSWICPRYIIKTTRTLPPTVLSEATYMAMSLVTTSPTSTHGPVHLGRASNGCVPL